MSIAIVVITDGRGEYLERTIASAEEMLIGAFSPAIVVDDSGDQQYADWLEGRFPGFWHVHHGERRGFGAVVRTAWEKALEDSSVTHLFHLEEDFTFNEPIDVPAMAEVLSIRGDIAQTVLKRQPWSSDEAAHGGQIEYCEARGDVFQEWSCAIVEEVRDGGPVDLASRQVLATISEHRINFSTNPSLISRRAAELCVETGEPCTEGLVTKTLLEAGFVFAYWGAKADPPRCTHIGEHRSSAWSE